MAGADYRSCDVCGGKAFYDANLNYDFENINPKTGDPKLDYLGDWAVICIECAKKYECVIVERTETDNGQ
jgi:hypothetical protein